MVAMVDTTTFTSGAATTAIKAMKVVVTASSTGGNAVVEFLEGKGTLNHLSKDFMIALFIAIVSALFVNGFLYWRETVRRRKVQGPIRSLVLRAFAQAQGELYEAIREFDIKNYKRIPTRIAHLGERLATIRDGLNAATIGGLGYFTQKETYALAACVGSIDWTGISSFDSAARWLDKVNARFSELSICRDSHVNAWNASQLRELRASFERLTTLDQPTGAHATLQAANSNPPLGQTAPVPGEFPLGAEAH